ncbi:MAG: Unknown protein [uncultured Aureispira sp.]|uniref:Tissue inhibitor of metalloproteinase n=1 Tax=uncultured Aureispira sp. TaxID=1331704 RepID=A0A6S6SUM1_9BACT|nr:MAG: Unknown protein [uncultured Aureispira sp.]
MIKSKLLFCLFSLLITNSLFACSCPKNNPEELVLDYLSTDILFEGTVLKIKQKKIHTKVVFKISKIEKGNYTKKKIVFYIDNSCSFELKKNEKWFIGVDNENKLYYTDICYTNYKIDSFAYCNFRSIIFYHFLNDNNFRQLFFDLCKASKII